MSKIKTAEQLSDEAVTELEAALQDTDFLGSDPEQPQVSGTAEGHVENDTLAASEINIEFALNEFDRSVEEATSALREESAVQPAASAEPLAAENEVPPEPDFQIAEEELIASLGEIERVDPPAASDRLGSAVPPVAAAIAAGTASTAAHDAPPPRAARPEPTVKRSEPSVAPEPSAPLGPEISNRPSPTMSSVPQPSVPTRC